MKEVNEAVLKDAANRLLFDMSEEQYKTLLAEFDVMIKQMKLISQIDGIDEAEPMTFPFECTTDYLREDIPGETLSIQEVLKNAGSVEDNQIKIPKVVK
jgi:aspartyl-tRNA(Asn)/glutamyl-tRNA(Gln) amidotransferase subunit C